MLLSDPSYQPQPVNKRKFTNHYLCNGSMMSAKSQWEINYLSQINQFWLLWQAWAETEGGLVRGLASYCLDRFQRFEKSRHKCRVDTGQGCLFVVFIGGANKETGFQGDRLLRQCSIFVSRDSHTYMQFDHIQKTSHIAGMVASPCAITVAVPFWDGCMRESANALPDRAIPEWMKSATAYAWNLRPSEIWEGTNCTHACVYACIYISEPVNRHVLCGLQQKWDQDVLVNHNWAAKGASITPIITV